MRSPNGKIAYPRHKILQIISQQNTLGTCSMSSRCAVVVNTLDQIRPESGVKPECACVFVCVHAFECQTEMATIQLFRKKVWGSGSRRQLRAGCITGRIGSEKKGRKGCDQRRVPKPVRCGKMGKGEWRQMGKIWESLFRNVNYFLLRSCFIRLNKLDGSGILYETVNVTNSNIWIFAERKPLK